MTSWIPTWHQSALERWELSLMFERSGDRSALEVLTAEVSPLATEREPVSAGGCPDQCGAHKRPCILRAHDGHHYCVNCPWPASPRMVRRASR